MGGKFLKSKVSTVLCYLENLSQEWTAQADMLSTRQLDTGDDYL